MRHLSLTNLTIKGALWDLDGVLADTQDAHIRALQISFGRFGLSIPYDELKPLFGTNTEKIFTDVMQKREKKLINAINIDAFVQTHSHAFCELVREEVKPVNCIERLLAQFELFKLKQAVASSSTDEIINLLLRKLNFEKYFTATVSGANLPAKPQPHVFLKAAEKLRLEPQECIVIEDSPMGVTAAKNAGMRCIGLTTTRSPAEIQQADFIISDLCAISSQTLNAWLS